MVLSMALAWAGSATAAPMTLEDAVAEALVKTRGIIHAKADLLLADVDKMAALSPILPRFDLTFSAQEEFNGSPIFEQRNQGGGLDASELLNLDPEEIRELLERRGQAGNVIKLGPFRDQNVASSSQPAFALQLTGRQLIYDGGRWWLVIGQAKDLEREKKAALAVVENDTRLNVATVFWQLEKSQRAAATVAEQVEVDLAQLARAKAMLEAGVAKLSDVAQAERNLAADRISLAQAEQLARTTRRQLALAVGRGTSEGMEIAADETALSILETAPREELVRLALAERPDLVRTQASLDAARKSVGIASADYYPVIGLEAAYSRRSRRPDRVFNDPTENYFATVGLGIQWNIFSGRATDAAVERAELELTKLEATYEELQRIATADVEQRIETHVLSMRVYELSLESIRAGEEAVRLARGLYAEGRGTALELRDAELRLTQQKLGAIEARIDVEIAREELRRAVGGTLPWAKRPG